MEPCLINSVVYWRVLYPIMYLISIGGEGEGEGGNISVSTPLRKTITVSIYDSSGNLYYYSIAT